ncbi:MAG: DUF1906 domain-containing protein [Alphaproteobacteria bacterium]|nr:DUF1906 domain-containing protein [Alphaproteobacteria bacterium]
MTRKRFELLLSALLLAACHSAPTVPPQPHSLPAQGIDLPTDASGAVNEIRDSKLDFVARYYRSASSRWPTLTASEAQRLTSLGLKIVAVWESHSHDPAYFSYASGYSDATSAYAQAKAIGQPPASAIYFAVDYNAPSSDIGGPIDQYFRGVAAAFAAMSGGRPEYKVGVYGSGAVCLAMKQAGLAQYTWLTNSTAWAGTLHYDDWNIRQGGHFSVLSFDHDSNEARDDYGGFRVASTGAGPVAAQATPVTASAANAISVASVATPLPASTADASRVLTETTQDDAPIMDIAIPAAAPPAAPYHVAAPRDVTARKTSPEQRWPLTPTAATSFHASCSSNCRAAKSMRTSMSSPSSSRSSPRSISSSFRRPNSSRPRIIARVAARSVGSRRQRPKPSSPRSSLQSATSRGSRG